MKNFYLIFIAAFVLIFAIIPSKNYAQCSCTGGVAPSTTTYLDVLNPTNSPSSTISFPQFDSTKGKLGCVTFKDTISGITTTYVQNLSSTKTLYAFLLTVANDISGPGISVTRDFTSNFGPDSLNAMGDHPGDSITYGPDKIFTNITDSNYTSNTSGYVGTGTVDYTYTLNGGLVSTQGSLNYADQIVTNYWGSFRLTYYWCPLATQDPHYCGFTAYKNGQSVQCDWQVQKDSSNCSYEIECSKNGSKYFMVGQIQSNNSENDTSSYQFQYPLSGGDQGKLCFRVKRTDSKGDTICTAIKTVNLNEGEKAGCSVYPNPVKSSTMMEFDAAQNSTFMVCLINQSGQIVLKKQVTLSGTNQIKINLTRPLATGVYSLQATDLNKVLQYTCKVFVQ
jgi:hypothetical protein